MSDFVTAKEAQALLGGKMTVRQGFTDDNGKGVDCSYVVDVGPVTPGQWLLETDCEDTGDYQPEGAEYPLIINVGDIHLVTEFESATVADARLMTAAPQLARTVVELHEQLTEAKNFGRFATEHCAHLVEHDVPAWVGAAHLALNMPAWMTTKPERQSVYDVVRRYATAAFSAGRQGRPMPSLEEWLRTKGGAE